ncbi:hypothetical protein GBF38_017698, partial [Nibea albiflora]
LLHKWWSTGQQKRAEKDAVEEANKKRRLQGGRVERKGEERRGEERRGEERRGEERRGEERKGMINDDCREDGQGG